MSKITKNEIIKVREYLIMRVRNEKKTVNYQELSDDCNLKLFTGNWQHMNVLSHLLTVISSVEKENGRPIISSIVVQVGGNVPGSGYEKVGKLTELKKDQDACFSYWNDESNFDMYNSLPEDQLNRIITLLKAFKVFC